MILLDFLTNFLPVKTLLPVLVSAFLGILFTQSGLDKVTDWSGNLSFLKEHFSKTFLKDTVPMMLGVVTIFEILAGLLCCVGVFAILFFGNKDFSLLGAELSALSLVMLFFGQRIAKDYAGAAALVPYFILSVIGVFIFG